jgi:2-amino-4-hydroxy-6-hydroxymethyldihydropteridine diphosphokinase
VRAVVTSYIAVGSNVGERRTFCREAVRLLGESEGIVLEATSSLYETTPIGGPPQRSFVNAVVRVSTTLEPRSLLECCKAIEARLGREEAALRWGPRVADLDILLYDDLKVNEPDLEIPHPRMTTRGFVLVPLTEIDPAVADPWGMLYRDLIDEAEGEVRLMEPF